MAEEVYCMGTIEHPQYGPMGCGALATKFEADEKHWHDWVWCEKHAKGRKCEPLELPPGRSNAERNADDEYYSQEEG